jgi:hypothetical protein
MFLCEMKWKRWQPMIGGCLWHNTLGIAWNR